MKRNLRLEFRGLNDENFEGLTKTFTNFIEVYNPYFFSVAHLSERFDDDSYITLKFDIGCSDDSSEQ